MQFIDNSFVLADLVELFTAPVQTGLAERFEADENRLAAAAYDQFEKAVIIDNITGNGRRPLHL